MPYVVTNKRQKLDPIIDDLKRALFELEADDPTNNTEGNVNYFVSTLLSHIYTGSYDSVNRAVGMLECIKLEYYRKAAAPYEDQKEFENGPVY